MAWQGGPRWGQVGRLADPTRSQKSGFWAIKVGNGKKKNLTTPRDAARRDLFISGLKSCFRPPYDELAQNGSYDPYGHVRVEDDQMADFGTFPDINHLLGRVKSLNLFLRHVITSVDVVKWLEEATSNKSL